MRLSSGFSNFTQESFTKKYFEEINNNQPGSTFKPSPALREEVKESQIMAIIEEEYNMNGQQIDIKKEFQNDNFQ